jgi:hypothetical protein
LANGHATRSQRVGQQSGNSLLHQEKGFLPFFAILAHIALYMNI